MSHNSYNNHNFICIKCVHDHAALCKLGRHSEARSFIAENNEYLDGAAAAGDAVQGCIVPALTLYHPRHDAASGREGLDSHGKDSAESSAYLMNSVVDLNSSVESGTKIAQLTLAVNRSSVHILSGQLSEAQRWLDQGLGLSRAHCASAGALAGTVACTGVGQRGAQAMPNCTALTKNLLYLYLKTGDLRKILILLKVYNLMPS